MFKYDINNFIKDRCGANFNQQNTPPNPAMSTFISHSFLTRKEEKDR